MTKTENLNLPQWEANDPIRREDFNEAMASIDAKVAQVEAVTISTSGFVDGDTIYTFSKAPRFVLLQGTYGTDLICSGKTITMLDYHSYNYKYLVTLKLSGTALIMNSRSEAAAIGTLRMVVFY